MGLIFRWNLTKLLVATQDDNICDSSYFLEILGRLKCTFVSPKTFKLSSGEGHPTGKVILRIVPYPMNYSFVVSKRTMRY